uniref:Iron-sulfur cluster formation ABC transporter ATP-binding subunit n=1 Tax=Olisthodiscus luteus TaxID=83000 RepID=A0A7U0KSH9_OLILU|nr:Iron-sulfur cluster formation ABC transporter ATP-binding subunit [Olisthodiscus luteus]QQW50557.1 Iron-sulfur cluster formation ABC transporter ATP-binding subunit [Olisthodiscus luteus]
MNSKKLLEINDLHAETNGIKILNGVNLVINEGETHAIMGPNGSGKSTLSKILAGHPSYNILSGKILFRGNDITEWEPNQRANLGLFLAFQYPIEIPGVNNEDFLRLAYNSKQKANMLKEIDPLEFLQIIYDKLNLIEMDPSFLLRNLNEGFSGGEKKRNEILQMLLLNPIFTILDEIDSGLDIDALKSISKGINEFISSDDSKSLLVITHYERLLSYIVPDYIHIMQNGRITKTGSADLAKKLEKSGYTNI